MQEHVYQNFTSAYYGLLNDVMANYDFFCSPRGQLIKEKLGVRFEIKDPRNRLPFIRERDFSVAYAIAEALFYFSGIDDVNWISYYSKFWDKISDDGKTVNSAYGRRIFKPHPYMAQRQFIEYIAQEGYEPTLVPDTIDKWTQWQYVIDELAQDNDSRRAVIHIRSPFDSRYAHKDVPCTLAVQYFIREDKLYQLVPMRSSDAVLGIANDVPAFTFFQEAMALELSKKLDRNIELGSYIHVSNSLHIYERNFEQVSLILDGHLLNTSTSLCQPMPKMPEMPPVDILLAVENDIRKIQDIHTLTRYNIPVGLHEYWCDWIKILLSHRAGKLNDKTLQKDLLQSTSWNGYHFFDR